VRSPAARWLDRHKEGAKVNAHEKDFSFRSLISLFIILVVAFSSAQPALADAPEPDKQTAKYEIKFMENMIDHHAWR